MFIAQPSPSVEHLSCILDHIEIAGDSAQLWQTISLELEDEEQPHWTDVYWKRTFKLVCAQLEMKQNIRKRLAQMSPPQLTIKSHCLLVVNELEKRLWNCCLRTDRTASCRVCLRFVADQMNDIFANEIAQKIVAITQVPEVI